jgi:tetratricopeptide (TPR) repeat protein
VIVFKKLFSIFLLAGLGNGACANAINSVQELEYGTVLFEYYQQQYFSALVEHEYAVEIGNTLAREPSAEVLKGGMMLSYGMAEPSRQIFKQLLDVNSSETVRNRAWFYLAKLYYQKGEVANASEALQNISGNIPLNIHSQYHYLATLINLRGRHLSAAEQIIGGVLKSSSFEPYLLYNLAVSQVQAGNVLEAATSLQLVTDYADGSEELAVLSDRARHGLAQLSVNTHQFAAAWFYLQDIRTTGLYSNRALLSYGWSAIKLQRFEQAIPALKMLEQRSIAIPEVQEVKVLLPHLYEQQGMSRKALKGYLLAEKSFKEGVVAVEQAREVIAMQDVPEEFVSNLEAISDDSDWYGAQPDINYQRLTPFLIDLMASHVFQATLKELGDLYALRKNLEYWSSQATQHELILNRKASLITKQTIQETVEQSQSMKSDFDDQKLELKLYTLTLDVEEQKRFDALLDTTAKELDLLDDQILRMKKIEKQYRITQTQIQTVRDMHKKIALQLKRTNKYISVLEPIMRGVVGAELDKHEERMRYYWAQARLAKARLYDSELSALENVSSKNSKQQKNGADQ